MDIMVRGSAGRSIPEARAMRLSLRLLRQPARSTDRAAACCYSEFRRVLSRVSSVQPAQYGVSSGWLGPAITFLLPHAERRAASVRGRGLLV